jgi:hypothetical protein
MELNQNPMNIVHHIGRQWGSYDYYSMIYPKSQSSKMGLQNGGNGGLNDNLQRVENNQQLEGEMINVDPSLIKNTTTTRRMELLRLLL